MRFRKSLVIGTLVAATAAGLKVYNAGAVPTPLQAPVLEQPTPSAAPPETLVPTPIDPPVPSPAVVGLRVDLQQIVARYNPGANAAVMVVSLDRGDTLFSVNPDLPLAPASNMKLFSTAAALYYLGPEFRYSTYVLADGTLDGGILHGDLVLFGTGDPSMSGRMLGGSLPPLRALADTLLAQGITEVRGNLVGDGSFFDAEWLGRGWSPDNFGAAYSAPVGALSLSENIARIQVRPGPAVGTPARITTSPATHGMAVVNRTTTVAGGQTGIRFGYEPEGLVISGRITLRHGGIERTIPIVDPVNFTVAAFRSVLEERGIRVTGEVRTVTEPAASPVSFLGRAGTAAPGDEPQPRVLGIHLSPPLSELISVTNHVSQNLFAEALLKTVGRVALGEGTFDAGGRAIQYFLECEAQVDTTRLGIVDGSGLSPFNRVTARATIQLLDMMTRNPHWEAYLASLPEAGHSRPRGLQRMTGTAAERNLRAKTGTIRNVSALSGYVTAANGERIAFAIIANNLPASTWAAKRIEDGIGARIADFDRQPLVALSSAPEREDPIAPPATGTPPEPSAAPARQTGQPADTPVAARTHRVRAGETLDAIARRNGTNVAALERANPGINPNRIRVGQTIRLPD
jgi:serine-type D-Ala-D-Ala carboxypeptidase/endopeptidase (penicillin-binding protein 4)